PGTTHINTDEFEEGPIWNQLSDDRLKAAMEANGITKDTLVVLYSAVQNMAAARIAWILMYCGVEDVRLLDGGFDAWKRAGLPVVTESTPKTPVKDFGGKVPARPELVIDTAAAKGILADPNGRLVSIRAWAEQLGETSGYGWLDRKGRIAGDVWGHSGPDSQSLPDFENVDGTMRNGAEIAALWDEWGIHPENRIATYCGTGWRAAEVNFNFYVLGWPDVVLYDGGWCEWSNDPANPVEYGEQKPQFK
ncbi:MAG: sulfurtransferase, partial [Fretibacterium sp.]|nr:sulfurtransferase [Fretibacterium sp.]